MRNGASPVSPPPPHPGPPFEARRSPAISAESFAAHPTPVVLAVNGMRGGAAITGVVLWFGACHDGAAVGVGEPSADSGVVDGASSDAAGEAGAAGRADAASDGSAAPDPFAGLPATVALAEAARSARWAAPQDDANGRWDIVYDGVDDPSVGSKSPFLWDVPADDDWQDPAHSFHWNTPARGFVTVDRTSDPIDYKTGRFTRRDEFVSHATGFTLAVKVRILPQSDPDAFFITYVNDYGSVTVLVSPDHYKVGGGPNPVGAPSIVADSTGDYRQFWLSQVGGSSTVSIYPDALAAPVTATLDPAYRVLTDENVAFPYVLVGDNSNEPTSNAAFVIDEIKYRRGGGFAPLSGLSPVLPLRTPPSPLPEKAATPESFGRVLEGDQLMPADPGGIPSAANPTCFDGFCTSGASAAWRLVDDPSDSANHFLELDNTSGLQGGARVENAPGLTNKGDLTMELRFRMFPDSEKRGFGLVHLDESGSFGVSLAPDGIEAFQGVKPFGFQSFAIDLTDRFHVLRMVRKANELYTQYYLDDHAVPIVVDEHLDASTEHRGFPVHPLVELGYIGLPDVDKKCHVLIDYLRFTDHAWAP